MPDSVSLSTDDLRRLEHAQELLMRPLDFPSVSAWRLAVNRALKALVGADKAAFLLRTLGQELLVSEEYEANHLQSYDELLDPLDHEYGLRERGDELGVFTRRMHWGQDYRKLLRSAYYNEFIRPARAFDALTISTGIGGQASSAQVNLHHDRLAGPRFPAKAITLLRLLFPAFRAGVTAVDELWHRRRAFGEALDTLEAGVLLYDGTGQVLHRNPNASRLLEDPELPHLRGAADRVARASIRLLAYKGRDGLDREDLSGGSEEIPVDGDRLRVSGTVVDSWSSGIGTTVLVTLSRTRTQPALLERARQARLTGRQAEVAALLAARKTNKEIASELGISPHTARHHTEKVLLRLGITNRRDVAPTLGELDVPE